ncbi:MAG: hypothetical protein ABIQ98_03680 [Sphingomicrobium sp.]
MPPISMTDDLASGLRALEMLAAHAPLDLARFAALNRLSDEQALALIGAFEQSGYVERVGCQSLFVLTPLALDLVPPTNAAARLH